MIKTDKVVYRTRTLKEYDWLMEKLGEAGCVWIDGRKPVESAKFFMYKSDTCIFVEDKKLTYSDFDFYKNESDYKDHEYIEVSDLMESEKKTEILDKLEILNEHLEDELKKLEKEDDESQKIKKIVYTTEVYFE